MIGEHRAAEQDEHDQEPDPGHVEPVTAGSAVCASAGTAVASTDAAATQAARTVRRALLLDHLNVGSRDDNTFAAIRIVTSSTRAREPDCQHLRLRRQRRHRADQAEVRIANHANRRADSTQAILSAMAWRTADAPIAPRAE